MIIMINFHQLFKHCGIHNRYKMGKEEEMLSFRYFFLGFWVSENLITNKNRKSLMSIY